MAADIKKNDDFSKGPISKTVLRLAVPMVLAQFVNVLYNIVDRMYIGHISDTSVDALTGVGVTFPILLMVTAFANLFGSGGTPLFSMARGAAQQGGEEGEKQRERAADVMNNTFSMLVITGVILCIVVLLLKKPVLYLFGASDATYPYADSYLSIYMLGSVFMMVSLGMNGFINAQGFANRGMLTVVIGAVVNIILDPMMIFGLLGCPAMGIRGAAIATVIGQLIGAAAALWFNRVKNPVIHVRLKGYRFLWQDVADIYRVGLPTIVMQAIGSVMTFAVNGILLGVSSTAVAFFGIYYKLQNFLMMPVNGLGQAAIPVVGFNYGSGQSDRVKQAWKVLLPTGVVFALCGTAVFLLFPAQLLGLFSASDEMLAFGVPALRIISVTFLFAVTTILCGYFASGLGNGVVNMIGAALRQLVVLVPCLWLLIRTMGIDRAWFAFWVSEVIACAYSLWATKKELRNKGK